MQWRRLQRRAVAGDGDDNDDDNDEDDDEATERRTLPLARSGIFNRFVLLRVLFFLLEDSQWSVCLKGKPWGRVVGAEGRERGMRPVSVWFKPRAQT